MRKFKKGKFRVTIKDMTRKQLSRNEKINNDYFNNFQQLIFVITMFFTNKSRIKITMYNNNYNNTSLTM